MRKTKKLLFYRDFLGFTGGHLKVWDYYNHAKSSEHYTPGIYFTERSTWNNNPWQNDRGGIERVWQPETADILFLAGVDWDAMPENWAQVNPDIPVINFIQHVRHGNPDDLRYRYLSRPAIRICVSQQVTEAIASTGKVVGPIYTIENCLDFENFPAAKGYQERRYDIVIFGLKQPELAATLYNRLQRQGINIKLITERIARKDYLDLLNDTKNALMLPDNEEGFYLPALEAMRMGTVVICPDCIGNRNFCHDSLNCLMPIYELNALVRAADVALDLTADKRRKFIDNAYHTSQQHDMLKEQEAFHSILFQAEDVWRDILA